MSGFISSFMTHTMAFLCGAFAVFILLAAAMTQAIDIHTAYGDAICIITK